MIYGGYLRAAHLQQRLVADALDRIGSGCCGIGGCRWVRWVQVSAAVRLITHGIDNLEQHL